MGQANLGRLYAGGQVSFGSTSPALDALPRAWIVGARRYYTGPDPTIIAYICTVAGTPGTWATITVGGTPYLGNVGLRSFVPGSAGGTLLNMMSLSMHQLSDNAPALQVAIPNWALQEVGPGAASTVTATLELPGNARQRLTLAGNPSMVIPDGGMIWTDPLSIVIPRNTWFNVYIYRTNAVGCVYTPNVQDHVLGERIEYNVGVDKTASGVINPTETAPWAGPCGFKGMTTRPSVCIMAGSDSIALGEGGTSTGTGAKGPISPSLQAAGIAWQNLAIGGTGPAGFLAGNKTHRLALAALCSHSIQEGGTNDLGLGDAQMRADLTAIAALLPAAQRKYLTTITPRTMSSDGWATLGNQTVTAFQADLAGNNAWRVGSPAGYDGCFATGAIIESGSSGKWLVPGYTADGLHPSQVAYDDILNSGIIAPSFFLPPT